MTRAEFDAGAKDRETYIQLLRKDAAKYQKAGITEQVLISFTSDPYHPFDTTLTRRTLETLIEYGMAFCPLSKGGLRALGDIDLFRPHRDAYAATLTSLDNAFSQKWEPSAALPAERIATLRKFHERDIFVWSSLEPILNIDHTLAVIGATHEFVDLYKVGGVIGKQNKRECVERLVELFAKLG